MVADGDDDKNKLLLFLIKFIWFFCRVIRLPYGAKS